MIDISKIFKPRIMRRGLLLAMLFAPFVYLFGTQFNALGGSHGSAFEQGNIEVPFSYRLNQSVAVNTPEHLLVFTASGSTRPLYRVSLISQATHYYYLSSSIVIVDSIGLSGTDVRLRYPFFTANYPFGNQTVSTFLYGSSFNDSVLGWQLANLTANTDYSLTYYYTNNQLVDLSLMFGEGLTPSEYQSLYNDYVGGAILPAGIDELVQTTKVIEGSYVDSSFYNFFNPNNWVSQLGRQVMQDESIGFAPVGELMRFTDDNMLHIKDTPWGDLAYGYGYYAINVFLLYEVVCLSMFVIALPFKIIDILEKKTGGDL